MSRLFWIVVISFLFLVVDVYAFQAVRTATQDLSATSKKIIHITYWSITFALFAGIVLFLIIGLENISSNVRNFFITTVFGVFISKLFVAVFLIVDDILRLGKWIAHFFSSSTAVSATENAIPRSEFLAKTGLIIATIPIVTMTQGIISGAYDYRIRRQKIAIKNLPSSFDGLTIAQISDIHSGSLYNKKAVMRGVEMLLHEKPDIVFFTGDLVNNEATEMKNYAEVFAKVKAPMGVYSTLGNHDYGDYIQWPSREAKVKNLYDLIEIHKKMGWDILMNENRIIESNGDKIAILGVENWGARGHFPKYGKLKEAYKGTEDIPVKLLLSHDPSHWRAQVLKEYKDIDVTFSGHTHGFQFGIETKNIKWSPVQYFYDEWAGLYKENDQHLYVNRGFGFIGFPGRIGILPEITIIELKKS